MGSTRHNIEEIEAVIRACIESLSVDLVLAQFEQVEGRPTLQIFIEGEGGVSLKDCAQANRLLLESDDLAALLESNISLEVSSPGVERPLRGSKDFQRFSGRRVQVKTRERVNGQRRHTGMIVSADELYLRLEIDGSTVDIPLDKVAKAKLKLSTEELFAGL